MSFSGSPKLWRTEKVLERRQEKSYGQKTTGSMRGCIKILITSSTAEYSYGRLYKALIDTFNSFIIKTKVENTH